MSEISINPQDESVSTEVNNAGPQADVHHSAIKDKLGDEFSVDYVRLGEGQSVADIFETSEAQQLLPDILKVLTQTFPDINESNMRAKFAGCNGIDLVKSAGGEPIGFHAYKMRQLQGDNSSRKVMYTSFAGVIPSYNGRRLTEISRLPVIDQEQPDIIAGSTSVPAIILSNQRIAQERGYALYPQDPNPPSGVVDLARAVYDATQKAPDPQQEHPVTPRLTRVRDNVVRKEGENEMPFLDEVMKLTPNEQVFYMLLKNNPPTPGASVA